MAKTLSEAPLTTRAARSNLSRGIHWRGIDQGIHLGYRRSKRGGEWVVRWRYGAGYRRADVGIADDHMKEGTLDFDAAVRAARKVVEKVRQEEKALADGPPLTVRLAIQQYVAARDTRESERAGRPVRSNASQRLGRYVLGAKAWGPYPATEPAAIADVLLHRLTKGDLREWRRGLPAKMKHTTTQRLVADFKAALNDTFTKHEERLPASFPSTVKGGLEAGSYVNEADDDTSDMARESQILTDAQIASLIRAAREVDAEKDFGLPPEKWSSLK